MKVKFLITRIVNDFRKGTSDEERYEAGEIYDLPSPSARRWIAREVAVIAEGLSKPTSEPEPAAVVFEELNNDSMISADVVVGDEPAPKRRGRPKKEG